MSWNPSRLQGFRRCHCKEARDARSVTNCRSAASSVLRQIDRRCRDVDRFNSLQSLRQTSVRLKIHNDTQPQVYTIFSCKQSLSVTAAP